VEEEKKEEKGKKKNQAVAYTIKNLPCRSVRHRHPSSSVKKKEGKKEEKERKGGGCLEVTPTPFTLASDHRGTSMSTPARSLTLAPAAAYTTRTQ